MDQLGDPATPGGSAPAASEGPKRLIGATIGGRYRVNGLIGEGGMGAVYLVEHTLMRKRMAVKVLSAELSKNPEMVARFEREALAAAHLEHPNVVTATDLGRTDDGALFLVLEYIDGQSLRDVLGFGPLQPARVLHIARQIAAALSRAHSVGIVHRDLKPENVMLVAREGDLDFVKVLDFGLAKVRVEELLHDGGKSEVLTRYGTIFGTPAYMAPEQAAGGEVDGRTDLYALGVLMYELLTGLVPFDSDDPGTLLRKQVLAPVPPMRQMNPNIQTPASLEALVMKLLEKDPDKRPSDARALQDAIEKVAAAEGLRYEPSMPLLRMAVPTSGPLTVKEKERDLAPNKDPFDRTTVVPQGQKAGTSGDAHERASKTDVSGLRSEALMPTQMADPDASPTKNGAATDEELASTLRGHGEPGAQSGPGSGPGSAPGATGGSKPGESGSGDSRRTGGAPGLRAPSVVDLDVYRPESAPNPNVLAPAPPPTPSERARSIGQLLMHALRTKVWPAIVWAFSRLWAALKKYLPMLWRWLLARIRSILPARARGISQWALGTIVATVLIVPVGLLLGSWIKDAFLGPPPTGLAALPGYATDAEMEGSVDSGPRELEALASKYPRDARVHRALVRAYAAKKDYAGAMRAIGPLLQVDPAVAYDEEIGKIVAAAALLSETSDAAFQILEGGLGELGVDMLLDLAERTTLEPWRTKINQSLAKEAVRKQASPEALLLLDLQAAARCEQKKALLARAEQRGGLRVLGYLRRLQVPTGCGPGGQTDCWPCLRRDKSLQRTVDAITKRGGAP